ncbi:MAG: DUF202 domain-containing protein [Verrucomicrobiota bacterium]|nr:DUF202 domain-containing protein [Verrucomicrobiota bacterium]
MAPKPKKNRVDHLANERTFLAWIRTSLGLMAFGFVVEKFALFMKQISYFFGKQEVATTPTLQPGYSSIFGMVLVIVGILIGLFAYFKYRITEKQIDEDTYRPSPALAIALTLTTVILGGFLVIYLILV